MVTAQQSSVCEKGGTILRNIMSKSAAAAGAIALALCATAANASLVTSISGGTVYSFPTVGYEGGGPQTVAPGIIWSSTNGSAVFGWTAEYGFGDNGPWNFPTYALDMAGVDGRSASMAFAFANPVGEVGGFLNYAPDSGTATIAAYNSAGSLLDSYQLTFSTSGAPETGEFFGFSEKTNDISYFVLTGGFIGITDLTAKDAVAAPEPASIALLGAGLASIGGWRLRRKAKAA